MSPYHKEEILKRFDEKFWYDADRLALCTRNMEVRDENEELIGYNQHGAVTPNDLKQFIISQIEGVLGEVVAEQKKYSPYIRASFRPPHPVSTLTNAYRKGYNDTVNYSIETAKSLGFTPIIE